MLTILVVEPLVLCSAESAHCTEITTIKSYLPLITHHSLCKYEDGNYLPLITTSCKYKDYLPLITASVELVQSRREAQGLTSNPHAIQSPFWVEPRGLSWGNIVLYSTWSFE